MYTILVCDDNSLLVTNKGRIMQRSKLVDTLQFLVPQLYNDIDMSDCTVFLEYILPCSRRYLSEILSLSSDTYKNHLVYTLPLDTKLTSEAGEIELQITFVKADLDESGNGAQYVRKTSTTKVQIVPISAWSDIIPDDALLSTDQRLIKMDAQIRAIDEMNQILATEKADNITYDEDTYELQLLAGNTAIGNKVKIKTGAAVIEDGIPVVDFTDESEGGSDNDTDYDTDGDFDIVEI